MSLMIRNQYLKLEILLISSILGKYNESYLEPV